MRMVRLEALSRVSVCLKIFKKNFLKKDKCTPLPKLQKIIFYKESIYQLSKCMLSQILKTKWQLLDFKQS